jgi:glutamate-1-semialdehyde 2,1-aminomutase
VTVALGAAGLLARRARRVLPGGNTRTTVYVPPHPPYAVRGSGVELEDADGHRLIDLQGNYTTLVHGHAHPEVTEAAWRALAAGACFGLPTSYEVELAELLCARVPALERVRFTNSGTEAVMLALRAARVFTGRPAVLRFQHAYHGSADAVLPIGAPGATAQADSVVVPFGDADALPRAFARYGTRLACVLIDLMPNRCGLEPASSEFIARLIEEARAHEALVVVDEVITFRLGVGGFQGDYGLVPDLVVLGKMIGGGFPVGAFGGRAAIMDSFDPSRPAHLVHGGTFAANPVTMAAGHTAVRLLDGPAIARINQLGDRLRGKLAEGGLRVTGQGSLLRLRDLAERPDDWWTLYRAGVLVAANGLIGLSTPMTTATVDEAADRVLVALGSAELA